MLSPLLTIEVDRLDAGSARLRLAGELDFDTAPELVEAAAELRRDGHQELWLDFADVTLCDSSGLSALVVIHRSGTAGVHVTDMKPQVRQLLDRTGLAELLPAPPRPAAADAREVG
ncbi:STAS domain-containing protein [Micromonospora sp. WMMC241]|uniref:STAS domain-containing protein n=1 Tax=Micromonospora sp. WMMC241 TaxID=3015159 RepID=UPI0022B6EE01|nr:STAS domain-containing protein [Micromonospora sp. WMMC241]MCZ7438008.1 STAS domain-containing protein [Micromonospora sp. WMMC241]